MRARRSMQLVLLTLLGAGPLVLPAAVVHAQADEAGFDDEDSERQEARDERQDARLEGRDERQEARDQGPAARQDARESAREGRRDARQDARGRW